MVCPFVGVMSLNRLNSYALARLPVQTDKGLKFILQALKFSCLQNKTFVPRLKCQKSPKIYGPLFHDHAPERGKHFHHHDTVLALRFLALWVCRYLSTFVCIHKRVSMMSIHPFDCKTLNRVKRSFCGRS
jgi:hypothetical protein